MKVATHKDLAVYRFDGVAEFRLWLTANAEQSESVWLQFAKKGSAKSSISYAEARDEALCFGWIDSVLNAFDEDFYMLRFSQRRPKSVWSKINCGIVEELIRSGRMTERGLAEVDKAKADGRWERAYEPQSTAVVPEDLKDAINASPKAAEFFATLKGTSRYALIYRTNNLKTPAARARKIAEFVKMLEAGEAPYLIKPKDKSD